MAIKLSDYMNSWELAPPLPESQADRFAAELSSMSCAKVFPRSLTASQETLFFLGRCRGEKTLGVLSCCSDVLGRFSGEVRRVTVDGHDMTLKLCPADSSGASLLRWFVPFLNPKPLGLRKSIGCGDRLGLATPGHIRAVRRHDMAPILAQQSVRENARTGRTPQEVMDDALWGVFQEGWREGFGSDADHLKTTADIDSFAAAGYTFFTVDPGEHVDNAADTADAATLRRQVETLPWSDLESTWNELEHRLADKPVDLNEFKRAISNAELLKAAAKYGRVVAHTVRMFRHLEGVMGRRAFELEMSVDETDTITTLPEHIYVASELKRLGVRWVSLAPRYVGTFEKGVDYIGDSREFERSFAEHLAVSKTFGPYKLSLHSGSDKFTIYPIASRLAGELVHLKTAGTSYLEALRAIARLDAALFREIVAFSMSRYPTDRASYHVSAEVGKMPDLTRMSDGSVGDVLEDFHGREILHVTFGSVLKHSTLRARFFSTLRKNEETYHRIVEDHFIRHLAPFAHAPATTGALHG